MAKAVLKLREVPQFHDCTLTLVGGGRAKHHLSRVHTLCMCGKQVGCAVGQDVLHRRREDVSSPELPEKVEDIDALDSPDATVEVVEGHDNETAVGMFFAKGLEALQVAGLHLLGRLDLDGHAGITQHGIHLKACVGAPVRKMVLAMSVVEIGHKLLNDKVLEGMAVVSGSPNQILALCEIVGNADIEIVEAGSLDQTALHHLGVGGDAIADEGVLEDVEIGTDGGGVNAAVLRNVLIVDDFSVSECRYLKKSVEGFQAPDQCLFLDLLFQIYIQISSHASSWVSCEVIGRQHAIVDGTVDVKVRYFCTHKRIEIDGEGASAKGVVALAFQFAGTGATENKDEAVAHNEPMYLVEQLWNLCNLINDNKCAFWLVLQHLIELLWMAHEAGFDAVVEQVKINGIRELLLQHCCLARLAGSKEKDAPIKLLIQLEKSCKHGRIFLFLSESYDIKWWLQTSIFIKNAGCHPRYLSKFVRKDNGFSLIFKEKNTRRRGKIRIINENRQQPTCCLSHGAINLRNNYDGNIRNIL